MMSILEYSIDVNLDVEKILALCDSLGIDYIDENSTLSDEDITMLDNNLSEIENLDEEESFDSEDEIEDEEEEEQLVEKFGSRKKIEKIKYQQEMIIKLIFNLKRKIYINIRKS